VGQPVFIDTLPTSVIQLLEWYYLLPFLKELLMYNEIQLLLSSSNSDECPLCRHSKSSHFTDKDGGQYCNACDCHGFRG